jgi:UDP-N-acetyl-D-mannosaminuronic acid dehydrogenase
MADLVEEGLQAEGVDLRQAKVAILGYAFLENSDDTRNTPSKPLIEELQRRGVRDVAIHDPYVRVEELPQVCRDLDEALKGADCACLVTAHREYRSLDAERLRASMRHALLVDGRNALRHLEGREGITVSAIGRGRP